MSDPTDPGGGVTGQHERARQAARVGDSGSPVGSPLTIVLAVIAVAVGFLIFRSIDDGSAGGPGPGAASTTVATSSTTTPGATTATTAAPTTAAPQRVTEGATVIVGNASSASGVATAMTEELAGVGYTMEEATDAAFEENLDTSLVHFIPGVATEQVAQSVARDLGGLDVTPMPEESPVQGGMGTATVLVLLGDDVAGESLEDLAGANAPNPTAPTPAAGTATTAG